MLVVILGGTVLFCVAFLLLRPLVQQILMV